MKFSASDGSSIVEDIRWLTGTDSTSFPIADITRLVNRWYHRVSVWLWQASKDWDFDDSNKTDLPIATTTLVANQKDYTLPTTAFSVKRVEVKDNNGDWHIVEPIDQTEVTSLALDEYYSTSGLPKKYDIIGRSLFLYPAPAAANVTLTNGLKIYVSREVDEFATTDTTKEPGFDEMFHRLLSLGAAYDFFVQSGDSRATTIRTEIELMKKEMMDLQAGRHENKRMQLKSFWKNIGFR